MAGSARDVLPGNPDRNESGNGQGDSEGYVESIRAGTRPGTGLSNEPGDLDRACPSSAGHHSGGYV